MKLKLLLIMIGLFLGCGVSWGQIAETFDSASTPPSGWTYTTVTHNTNNPRTGARSAVFDANNDAIITPLIISPNLLSFWWRRSTTAPGSPVFVVSYSSSLSGPWTQIGSSITSFTTTYQNFTANLSAYSNIYIRVLHTRSSGTNEVYIDDFSVTTAPPEIAISGNSNTITDGDTTPTASDFTDFGSVNIGNSKENTFVIANTGTGSLTLSGTSLVDITGAQAAEFTVTVLPATPVAATNGTTTFEISFLPAAAGLRTATITIDNNDSDENPYNFSIQGTGTSCTAAVIASVFPTSGPSGTQVTITASSGLLGATATLKGANCPVVSSSATQLVVTIPAVAETGDFLVRNSSNCPSTVSTFTVFNTTNTTCQGSSVPPTDLIIYEVYDEDAGGGGGLVLYNGTTTTRDLTNYRIYRAADYGGSYSNYATLSGTIAPGAVGIIKVVPSSCGLAATNGTFFTGFNGNDGLQLRNAAGTTVIDDFKAPADKGYYLQRSNTALTPATTFVDANWTFTNTVSVSGVNTCISYGAVPTLIPGVPPSATSPVATTTCKTGSIAITGTEGYNGTSPDDAQELTYQWFANAPGTASWFSLSNGLVYSGVTSATLTILNSSTLNNYQFYCSVRENDTSCSRASTAVRLNTAINWNGTNWVDVNNVITTPSISKTAIISTNYSTASGSFDACTVVVNAGRTLTITPNTYVRIQNELTNNGTVTINNSGSLVQINDAAVNAGDIRYEREYFGINLSDYTYWSSPVAGQNLLALSPTTKLDKFFSFDADITNDWKLENPITTTMEPGKGYIIRAPPFTLVPPPSDTNTFIGVPHNGEILVPIKWILNPQDPLSGTSNLIGNPYPSAVDAVKFLTANTGIIESTIYFWTNATDFLQSRSDIIANGGTPGSGTLAYTSNDYASFNLTGGVAVGNTPDGTLASEVISNKPDGTIAAGQAFFVTGLPEEDNAFFNNSMRVRGTNTILSNSQFFKTRNTNETTAFEKHRIWLNLRNTQGLFKQTLIGYLTDATNQYDKRFDGVSFDANEFADFYSVNQDKNLVIQGRALPFDEIDEVPLGFRTTIDGTFTINIDETDGVLTNQAVFIEDKLTNTVFDLRTGPYTFTTKSGTFNDRFVLRYTNKTLGIGDVETLENQVLVSNKNKQIKVNSAIQIIDKVTVYDLLGRQLFKKEKVNNNELAIPNLVSSQQTLLVKVSLQNGQTVTRKIMY